MSRPASARRPWEDRCPCHLLGARAAVLCARWTCGHGRSTKCVVPLSASLWHPLWQLRPLVALSAGIPGGARRRAGSARTSAWCRDGGETAFCAARRPSCRCFRGVSVRARPVCNFSSLGITALFTGALVLDAGFGEPYPGCHAGAARSPVGCTRAILVSLDHT